MTIDRLYDNGIISTRLDNILCKGLKGMPWVIDPKHRAKTFLFYYDILGDSLGPDEATVEDVETLGVDYFKHVYGCGKVACQELENLLISFA